MPIFTGTTLKDDVRFVLDYVRLGLRNLRHKHIIPFAILTLAVLVIWAAGETRPYFPVAIADMPKNLRTHVQVTGPVAYKDNKELDGDEHMEMCDQPKPAGAPHSWIVAHCVIAECIPTMPDVLQSCKKVKVGQTITVRGISRFDGEHKWWEVHPVEKITVIKTQGRAQELAR